MLHNHAAVYIKRLAGNVRRCITYKEENSIGNMLRFAERPKRNALSNLFANAVLEDSCHIGVDKAWRNDVDRDPGANSFAAAFEKPITPAFAAA